MKKTLLTILSVLFCAITFAQSVPQGINYQAVARDANGDVLMNQALTIQFSVISDITTSAVSWQETHTVTTNDYGLFTAIIGQGTSTSVGVSATFDVIDWGASNHLLKVELDYGGGLVDMGTTAFMSVPYSLNADPTDELQSLSISGDTLFISSGNWIILPSSTPTLLGCTDPTSSTYNPLANTDDGSCCIDGCIDPLYLEYDASATCDDGSCLTLIVNGCTDATACNYNASANVDDGSCDIPNGCGDPLYLDYDTSVTCSDPNACLTLIVNGCMDSLACNYNASANVDDGSCLISYGCTDLTACNYDANATCDDGSCILPDGCTDPLYLEYDANAQCDDGSCATLIVNGCMDSTACNYDATTNVDDGSCIGQVNGYCVFQPVDLAELKIAVNLWISDPTTAFLLYGPINSNWDLSLITSMADLFRNKSTFNDDISNWDVSNVQNMNSLFYSATSFDQDISNWVVSNVTDMYSMFYNATSFNKDISNWDVSSVTDMNYMFSYAEVFNIDLSTWNVSNVTNMNYMFKKAYLFNQDISSWNVSSVTDMHSMFYETSFDQDISSWNISPSSISQVTDMTYMFYNTPLSNLNKCLINNSFSPHPIWDPLYNTTPPPTYYEYFGMCSGCTYILACNYNPVYLNDDGTCLYGTLGCTDSLACNYDASATCDDGSCLVAGCTISTACNYDPNASCDDGSCLTAYGCTDSSACNYDTLATCDNGGCTFYGCTDPNACNYDVFAACDDGSCLIAYGCTNTTASNYDPLATCDDGSCVGGVSIGDAHQGGIVIYIAPTPVDLNGDGNINLGLIAANEDQGTWKEWGCNGTSQGAWGTAIGTGAQNTNIIVSGCNQPHIAAKLCNDYAGGGYTDWFLPSEDEAAEMFSQKAFLSNFDDYWYWTSSENNSTGASVIDSNNESISTMVKINPMNVRAIRAF